MRSPTLYRPLMFATAWLVAMLGTPAVAGNFEVGTVTGSVSGISWVTLPLQNTYVDPVVVCTLHYSTNTRPVVVRAQDTGGGALQVRLWPVDNGMFLLPPDRIHYLVMETGVWRLPDGRSIEAHRVEASQTSYKPEWETDRMVELEYVHAYSAPVVLGSVMSSDDLRWSAFWCRAASDRRDPPTATSCFVGKHVGEDPDTTRTTEWLGVVVIETGSGQADGVDYAAALGPQTVHGVADAPPYPYAVDMATTPAVALISNAAHNGADGTWPYLYGAVPLRPGVIDLAVDEDAIGEPERNHTTEALGYLLFSEAVSLQLTPAHGPYATGFEPPEFTTGSLHGVGGWVGPRKAGVQDQLVAEGQQAARIEPDGGLGYAVELPEVDVVWCELSALAPAQTLFPALDETTTASCLFFHHAEGGLTCLDGDGVGSGTWQTTGLALNDWDRLSVQQNFTSQTWSVYVNGCRAGTDLGFKDSRSHLGGLEVQAGSSATLHVDRVALGYTTPSVPLFDLSATRITFAPTPEGQSDDQTLWVTNLGDDPLTLTATVTPPHDSVFHVLTPMPMPALAPGTSGRIDLRFTPDNSIGFAAPLALDAEQLGRLSTFLVPLSGDGLPKNAAHRLWPIY